MLLPPLLRLPLPPRRRRFDFPMLFTPR